MDATLLTLRTARTEDRERLYELLSQSWMTTWAPHCSEQALATFRQSDPVAKYLDACLNQMEVAEHEGSVVAMMHIVDKTLAALHVDPGLKGRGIGSALMNAAEKQGASMLEVRAFNREAIRFYERRGWIQCRVYSGVEMGDAFETLEYRYNPQRKP